MDLIDVAPVDGPAYEATTLQARSAGLAQLATSYMEGRKSGAEIITRENGTRRVELYFLDQIVPSWLSRYMTDTMSSGEVIEALEAVPDAAGIDVFINSPGGDVFEAMAIYNTLKAHPAPVNVYVRGLAASAAGIIAMAGDHIQMGEGSFLMMHNAWTYAQGNAAQLRQNAVLLDKIDAEIAGILASRSGNTVDAVSEWMRDETWMNTAEAVQYGFADRTGGTDAELTSEDGERCRDLGYRNIPKVIGGRGAIQMRHCVTNDDYMASIKADLGKRF